MWSTTLGRVSEAMWRIALLVVCVSLLEVGCYIEVVEERGCHDAEFRLTCRHLDAHIAILSATFSNNASLNDTSCFTTPEDETTKLSIKEAEDQQLRLPLNHRCSGVNHCSFILASDFKQASNWGPGVVNLKYACVNNDDITKFCNEEITVENEGFVQSPGYPKYYVGQKDCSWGMRAPQGQRVQLTLLDVSLRGIGPMEVNCTDKLQVTEDNRLLLSTCGEEDEAIAILSEGNVLNVSIASASKTLFPKRGVLFHYKAVGCPSPPTPRDGYLVHRNETDAQYMCCVDHVFPDTYRRDRILHCENGNTWNLSLPDCINVTNGMWGRNGTLRLASVDANMTNSEVAAIIKESDFMFDVMLPTLIICVLLIGNGVIIFVIFYLRKRKLPHGGDDEELGAIYQPQDGSEKAINV